MGETHRRRALVERMADAGGEIKVDADNLIDAAALVKRGLAALFEPDDSSGTWIRLTNDGRKFLDGRE